MKHSYALAIHGGAGVVPRAHMGEALSERYHTALRGILERVSDLLSEGESSVAAVEAAVCALEDDPLFNAGRGAVFTAAGGQEMDAAIMDGRDRRAGAVGGLLGPRNPVQVARVLMEQDGPLFMIGAGALAVARRAGLPFESEDYFRTEERQRSLEAFLELQARGERSSDPSLLHGTVGAVALDKQGNLAAATSTGGFTGKQSGRIGDSPIIGAGTFADNATCAVSATGSGEVFIRWTAASEIAARMQHAGEPLEAAANHVVQTVLAPRDGSGGLIAVDREGNISMPFNCEGMYRGSIRSDRPAETHIYR
ncbi:isoaspartyl peptidase/L-asparaginase family protein [Fodinicurvata fenggangensis]|uniref:isoaspartyl peptidase/L-asparaginase family protein n=1 Tax=Fodinicurvata fenggangensis TaxID=1121830 RepID=UPI000478EC03|nr:isoaspartyl peptidase/L-asparaginase [Fodinicurvata fenggangensis]